MVDMMAVWAEQEKLGDDFKYQCHRVTVMFPVNYVLRLR